MSFQLVPKIFGRAEMIQQFFCKLNSSNYFTCPSGKLRTEFTSPIAKSTSPGLSDTKFFARWLLHRSAKIPKKLITYTSKVSVLTVSSITGDPSPFHNNILNVNSTCASHLFFLRLFKNVLFALLFGRRQNRVIEFVLIQSCNRHAIRANVNKPSKQAKRREYLPRAVSQHSIYLRYIRPTDNTR